MSRLQECPAITALSQALNVFPSLRRDILVNVLPATRHTSGLAIDIFFNSNVPEQKQRALDLIDVLVKHQKDMQWSDLIFTNFHIGGGIGGYMGDGHTRSSWTGGGHDDHIHLDWVDRSLRTGPDGSAAFINNPWEHSDISKSLGGVKSCNHTFRSRRSCSAPPAAPQVLPVPTAYCARLEKVDAFNL